MDNQPAAHLGPLDVPGLGQRRGSARWILRAAGHSPSAGAALWCAACGRSWLVLREGIGGTGGVEVACWAIAQLLLVQCSAMLCIAVPHRWWLVANNRLHACSLGPMCPSWLQATKMRCCAPLLSRQTPAPGASSPGCTPSPSRWASPPRISPWNPFQLVWGQLSMALVSGREGVPNRRINRLVPL